MFRLSFGVAVLAGLLPACATVQVGGFDLYEDRWKSDSLEVKTRAAFDFHCPAENLTVTPLGVLSGYRNYAGQIGVEGCDQQSVYVSTLSGWIQNSQSK